MRSNRTQLLRQLALKQKLDKNPFLASRYKISRADALTLGDDPHFNDINYNNEGPGRSLNRVRMRNKRGEYMSVDPSQQAMGRFPNTAGDP